MRFGLLTRSVPPEACGIGDHSVCFANALRAQGHEVFLFAGRGAAGEDVCIIGDEWTRQALDSLRKRLEGEGLEQLVLQYTPLLFSDGNWRTDLAFADFWRKINAAMPTSLIVHETYYRTLRHPRTCIRGAWEKFQLRRIASASAHVFSSSQLVVDELSSWSAERPVTRLPLGSHIDVYPVDREAQRKRQGFSPDEIVLTLFGRGNNLLLMRRHLCVLENRLRERKVAHAWLLLGGAPRDLLSEDAHAVSPGWLNPDELSANLQMSDIFLMPHFMGVSAKRSTLIAAMAHGLAVVGTHGEMTDPFWKEVPGVALFSDRNAEEFAQGLLAVCRDAALRRSMGSHNLSYFNTHMTWPFIASKFTNVIRTRAAEGECLLMPARELQGE